MSDILIVIPCLNEEKFIGSLVENLVANTISLAPTIVIADGLSTDNTAKIAKELSEKFSNVFYALNPKKLQSAAINLAIEKHGAGKSVLIRIDAHAEYPKNFCEILVEEQKATQAASVVVAMDTVGKEGFQKAVAAAQNSKLGNGGSAHRNAGSDGKWVDHGHHALMRIDAYCDVGGYDESFSHNEDAELDIRLCQKGYKIWLTGKTGMTYYPRSAALPLYRQYYKFGEGRARTIFKHRIIPRVRQMIPLGVAPAVVLAVLGFMFSVSLFMMPFYIWAGICLSYGALLAYRAKDKDIIGAGWAIMVMHFAWSVGFFNFLFQKFVMDQK